MVHNKALTENDALTINKKNINKWEVPINYCKVAFFMSTYNILTYDEQTML